MAHDWFQSSDLVETCRLCGDTKLITDPDPKGKCRSIKPPKKSNQQEIDEQWGRFMDWVKTLG